MNDIFMKSDPGKSLCSWSFCDAVAPTLLPSRWWLLLHSLAAPYTWFYSVSSCCEHSLDAQQRGVMRFK